MMLSHKSGHRLCIIALLAVGFTACREQRDDTNGSAGQLAHPPKETVDTSTDWSVFGSDWRKASLEERRAMADVRIVHDAFQGANKEEIVRVFGDADQAGIDSFGDDVLRYELGKMPQSQGRGQFHLTFVFENDGVVRVMGNFATLSSGTKDMRNPSPGF